MEITLKIDGDGDAQVTVTAAGDPPVLRQMSVMPGVLLTVAGAVDVALGGSFGVRDLMRAQIDDAVRVLRARNTEYSAIQHKLADALCRLT